MLPALKMCVRSTRKDRQMGEVINIEDKEPHEVSELICLKCLNRWIGVYPEKTLLKQLECRCGEVGYVIKTGQTIER